MILRRFMKHVNDQNWFAVGLDVIVVVVGIFLGMQVTEWNDQRKDRVEEGEYLLRVTDDIGQMLEDQRVELASKKTIRDQIYFTLQVLESGVLEEDQIEDFEAGLWATGKMQAYITLKYQIPSLQNSTDIALISNRNLRIKIRDHDENMRNYQEYDNTGVAVNNLLIVEMTRLYTWQQPSPGGSKSTNDLKIWYNFDAIVEERKLYNRLGIFYGSFRFRLDRSEEILKQTEDLLSSIEAEYEQRGF